MSEYVKRIIPFESSDIPAIQKWFEDMSAKGLLFESCGLFFAKFKKGEPKAMRYRLDVCDVVACDIPEEKKELYEKDGWEVMGEFKSDLVVLGTSDPNAPEIYTEYGSLVKPLRKLATKRTVFSIAFFVMFMLCKVAEPINILIGGKGSMVDTLIRIGTLKYILLVIMAILLLLEALLHFIRARHLKKLIKNIERGDELPQSENWRGKSVFGSVLVPLSIPLAIVWFIHIIFPMGVVRYSPVEDLSGLPFPTIDEVIPDFQADEKNMLSSMYDSCDLLASRVLYFHQEYPDAGQSYMVEYYDMRSEGLAREFIDGQIDDLVNYDRQAYAARMESLSQNENLDFDWDGFLPEYTLNRHDRDGAEVYVINEKYAADEACVRQWMYIKLSDKLIKVRCKGIGEISDYVQLYIDRLQSA